MKLKTPEAFLRIYDYIPPEHILSRRIDDIGPDFITVTVIFEFTNEIFSESLKLITKNTKHIEDAILLYAFCNIRVRLDEIPYYGNDVVNRVPPDEFDQFIRAQWARIRNTPKY